MIEKYDVCVDYEILREIEDKLLRISRNLQESTRRMNGAIAESNGFLLGEQFEKARKTTLKSTQISDSIVNQIIVTLDYIGKLKEEIEKYSRCGFELMGE